MSDEHSSIPAPSDKPAKLYPGYPLTADEIVVCFGKLRLVQDLRPEDFARLRKQLTGKWGPVCVGKMVQCIRSVFKYAYDAELLNQPVRFGPEFKRPSKKTIRQERAKASPKLFTAEEIRRLLAAASVPVRAMILLGINCGLGNADCTKLPLSVVELDQGWIDYPRPKTGLARRCPLWPETAAALREALAQRPTPKDAKDAPLVFITKYGLPWNTGKALPNEFAKLLKALAAAGLSRAARRQAIGELIDYLKWTPCSRPKKCRP